MFRRLVGRARSRALTTTAITTTALTLAALLAVPAATAATTAHAPDSHHAPFLLPDRIELPDGFLPEGIATGLGPFAWFGSRADGDIYRANLLTGRGKTVSQGPGTPSIGLKIDLRGRLFVAGGPAGDARVVSANSGRIIESYQLTDSTTTFVNDVVLTPTAAWFTDSMQAQLYRLPLGRLGALPDAAETVPLTGEWEQVEGFNANGISRTPDGQGLLVVNSTTGLLYRVDPSTGEATEVDLGGELLTNGDGLLLLGRTLFVVRNQDNLVAVVRLDDTASSGTVVDELTSDDFDVPTTAAAFAGGLYLPNARFNSPQEPTTEFWVTRVELPRSLFR
jgi:sugar lactone lactonase YvrE